MIIVVRSSSLLCARSGNSIRSETEAGSVEVSAPRPLEEDELQPTARTNIAMQTIR